MRWLECTYGAAESQMASGREFRAAFGAKTPKVRAELMSLDGAPARRSERKIAARRQSLWQFTLSLGSFQLAGINLNEDRAPGKR